MEQYLREKNLVDFRCTFPESILFNLLEILSGHSFSIQVENVWWKSFQFAWRGVQWRSLFHNLLLSILVHAHCWQASTKLAFSLAVGQLHGTPQRLNVPYISNYILRVFNDKSRPFWSIQVVDTYLAPRGIGTSINQQRLFICPQKLLAVNRCGFGRIFSRLHMLGSLVNYIHLTLTSKGQTFNCTRKT